MRVVLVTGLSGAGKITALRALEDIGFYCTDNLPLPLLPNLVVIAAARGVENVAVAVDARQESFLGEYRDHVGALRKAGHQVDVLFLEASDDVLLRRFSETRRRHPLAGDDLVAGIARDREVLSELRQDGEIVSTSSLNVHQLRGIVQERYGHRDGQMAVTFVSFGFKHGLPREADVVFDVRFLPNPYFVETLSGRNGKDREVADYVLQTEDGAAVLSQIDNYLHFSLPRFASEGKQYLTIAVGCTGGRHRSVAVIEALSAKFSPEWDIHVRHRDLK